MGEARAQQALLLMRQGRFPQSLERSAQSLDLLRTLDDPDLLVRPLLIRNIILCQYFHQAFHLGGGIQPVQPAVDHLDIKSTDRLAETAGAFEIGPVQRRLLFSLS